MYLSSFPFPARAMYNLEEMQESPNIAINILPLLAKEIQNKGEPRSQNNKAHK